MALVKNRDIPFLLFEGACYVLYTGIYIASSPPLGHHHPIHIYTKTHHIPLPQLVQAVTHFNKNFASQEPIILWF
jgi:hypothetical protein